MFPCNRNIPLSSKFGNALGVKNVEKTHAYQKYVENRININVIVLNDE